MRINLRSMRESEQAVRLRNAVAPLASAAIVLLFGAIAYTGARREDESMQIVAHTDSVIAANQAVLEDIEDGKPPLEIAARMQALRDILGDRPREQSRVDAMERLLAVRGTPATDSARRLSAAIERDEQQLLTAQNDDQDAHELAVRWIVGIGSVVAAGLAWLVGAVLARSADAHARLADEARALNEELQVINEQLEERTAEAEEANKLKTRFLANMSHDLRTPLNAIIGYADLLEFGVRGSVSPGQREDLQRIRRSGKHLAALINDVLEFAKIEAGRLRVRVERVSIQGVLSDVEAIVAPQIEAAGLQIFYACESDLMVSADRERLDQILVNLVGNAIKFTEPGGRIEVACTGDGARASVAVHDTGRGIPEHQLDAVFEPFVQVESDRAHRGQRGVGLGLAISRELARAMRGELTVASTPGQGSTFTLRLERAA